MIVNKKNKKRQIVLKNKKRFIFFLFSVFLSVVVMLGANYAYGTKEAKCSSVVVKKGDTLWNIAQKINYGGDIRKVIYEIKRINSLESSAIYEGQLIRLP